MTTRVLSPSKRRLVDSTEFVSIGMDSTCTTRSQLLVVLRAFHGTYGIDAIYGTSVLSEAHHSHNSPTSHQQRD